jgi:hypothetical protein
MIRVSIHGAVRFAALVALASLSSGCVAAVPAMVAASYAMGGVSLGIGASGVAAAHRQADIAQQNADTYKQAVQQAAVTDAPQCVNAAVRASCPLYQYRVGLYRGKCQDGSGLEVGPGYMKVIPPAFELAHPWQAEGCTFAGMTPPA